MGDWLDSLDSAQDLGELPIPVKVLVTSHTMEEWSRRTRSDENELLAYAADKLYWSWRFELPDARFDSADALRLRASVRRIASIMELEEGTSWTDNGHSDISLAYKPLPPLLKQQREKRLLGQKGAGSATLEALQAPRYDGVRAHLAKAEAFLHVEPPDLANSAKESVCAVELLARLICNSPKDTLGDLIKKLQSTGRIDTALAKSLEGIWGFTSNAPAVRHGGKSTLDVAQAQLVLQLARSSIVYLLRADTD